MSKFEASPASMSLTQPVCTMESSPTWGALMDVMKGLAEVLEGQGELVAKMVGQLDSRGKGRLDILEIRKVRCAAGL